MTKLTKSNKVIVAGQLLIIGLLSFYTTSCKDDSASLGGDVLPKSEELSGHVYNNYNLTTTTKKDDAIVTSDASSGFIGSYKDDIFGHTEASFAFNFSLGAPVSIKQPEYINENNDTTKAQTFIKFDNGVNNGWELDSVSINLQYSFNEWIGNMTTEQVIEVYEITSALGDNNVDFLSNRNIGKFVDLTNPIAFETLYPNMNIPTDFRSTNFSVENLWSDAKKLVTDVEYLWDEDAISDSLKDDKDNLLESGKDLIEELKKESRTWRITIDKDQEFAKRLFGLELSDDHIQNQSLVKNMFHGLYFKVRENNEDANLTRINLLDSDITLHFHRKYDRIVTLDDNKTALEKDYIDSHSHKFVITRENIRFNLFEHDLSKTEIKLDVPNQEKLHIQGMASTYTEIEFPTDIFTWIDSVRIEDRLVDHAVNLSSIKFQLDFADDVYYSKDGVWDENYIYQHPTPSYLDIGRIDEDNRLIEPTFTEEIGEDTITYSVFGGISNTEAIGKLKKHNQEYHYEFIMNPRYFEQVMREVGRGSSSFDTLTDKDLEDLIKKHFTFYIRANSSAENMNRVVLSARNLEIKYFRFTPTE